MKLNEMTNKDLIEYCEAEGIDVDSKNVSKPTKKELLTAIELFEKNQMSDADEFLKEAKTEEPEIEEEIQNNTEYEKAMEVLKEKKKPKLTRAQKRKKQHDELMPLKRVIITTNADNQTKTNLEFITWGNGLIGHHTDRVYLGKAWHVREGALRNMERAIITESVQNEDENRVDFITKNAYNIQRLDPLSEAERERIGKRQIIRDASIESLI
ncbi:MAG: hypothetical protein KAH01_07260 [Caldisericia bacterium]|nr:hypothetical protein [Caldisericia bacterium]